MTRIYKYTKEHIDFVKENAEGRYNDELAEMFNKRFNTTVMTASKMNSFKSNRGIRSNVPRSRPRPNARLLTPEQDKFLRENVKGVSNKELAEMLNKKFGLSLTEQQINTYKCNWGLSSGLTGWFEKGEAPWNKGMKGIQIGGKETQFKKGHRPLNYRPVGSERICSKDGYVIIKTQDEGKYQERWRLKHIVVWEEAHGKIPDDHVIIFLDGDKTNVNLENLACISRAEHVRMNQSNLFSTDPELTKAGIQLARLNMRIVDADLKGNDLEYFNECVKRAEKNGVQEQTFIARLRRGWNMEDAANAPLGTHRSQLQRS